jgi:hypothetical protein
MANEETLGSGEEGTKRRFMHAKKFMADGSYLFSQVVEV